MWNATSQSTMLGETGDNFVCDARKESKPTACFSGKQYENPTSHVKKAVHEVGGDFGKNLNFNKYRTPDQTVNCRRLLDPTESDGREKQCGTMYFSKGQMVIFEAEFAKKPVWKFLGILVIQKIMFQVFGTVDFENYITFRESLRRMALEYISYPIASRGNVFDDVFMDTRALKTACFAQMPKDSKMPKNLHFVAICNAILHSWYKNNLFKPTEDKWIRQCDRFSNEVCERFPGLVATEIINVIPFNWNMGYRMVLVASGIPEHNKENQNGSVAPNKIEGFRIKDILGIPDEEMELESFRARGINVCKKELNQFLDSEGIRRSDVARSSGRNSKHVNMVYIPKIMFQVFGTVDFENFITFREKLRRMALEYISYPVASRGNVFDDVFMDTRALKTACFAQIPKDSKMPKNLHFVAICNAILHSWYKNNLFKPTEDEWIRQCVRFSNEVCERFPGLVTTEIINVIPLNWSMGHSMVPAASGIPEHDKENGSVAPNKIQGFRIKDILGIPDEEMELESFLTRGINVCKKELNQFLDSEGIRRADVARSLGKNSKHVNMSVSPFPDLFGELARWVLKVRRDPSRNPPTFWEDRAIGAPQRRISH